MADDENLVSQVQVTGTEESAAALEKYADRGAAAFDKVNKAAKDSAAGVKASTADVESGASDAKAALDQLGNTKVPADNAARLKEVGKAAFDLGNETRKTIKDLSQFVTRVVALGAAAAASAAGVLKLASSVAKQAQGTSDALDKQAQAQTDANDRQLEATQSTINYQSAQRKLFQQFQQGAIDYATYSANLRQLSLDFQEQRRVQQQLQDAADATKEANDRLQKQLADRKVYNDLIDTWGGPMLTALKTLGAQVNSLFDDFKTAFGPAVAGVIDAITAVLNKNGSAISNFFGSAAQKIDAFVKQNGPEIEKALTSIGEIAAGIFNGLISALPTLLAIFNNGIVPTIKAVGTALQVIADLFNKAFGTDVTAGVVAVTAAVATLTGGVKLFIGVLQIARAAVTLLMATFGPWGLLIAAVALALGFLATQVDWAAFADSAKAAVNSVLGFFQALPGQILGFFTGLWDSIASGWNTAVAGVIAAWNTVTAFFTTFGAAILAFFTSFWTNLTGVVGLAAQAVIDAWNAVIDFFTNLGSTISGIFSGLWDGVKAAVNTATTTVRAAWDAIVAFFTNLPATLASIWTTIGQNIQDAFQSAVTAVKQYLSDLATSALSYLQPIIDALKQIISLNGQADTGSGGAQAFAGGGHVRGAGSSTSDSIAAWLSNNEFVMKAKAVRRYGTDFMRAINDGRFDPSAIPRFANGGLVQAFSQPRVSMAPVAMASGGSTAAARILNLTIGDQQFDGLMAPDAVADRMERFAVGRYARSAGRKPSWVGGTR